MKGVEEIPKGRDSNIYFSSLYHLNPTGGYNNNSGRNIQSKGSRGATPDNGGIGEDSNNGDSNNMSIAARQNLSGSSSSRKRVNYNIQQIQAEQFLTARPKSKSITEEFEAELIDLTGESSTSRHATISLAELRKAQRRFDELNRENYNENSRIEIPKNITGLIVKRNTSAGAVVKRLLISKKGWSNFTDELNKNDLKLISNDGVLEVKPNALQLEKLCTICGMVSYSSCIKCSARVCSVKCQNIHNETRCTHF
ncbi:hypothetical protein C6P40_004868 [Pichia californica]|uniref:HIT-type domain-containing protein n=1 Tax=Pichia californica TaxID=460514 RepID=A0A9P6WM42_9ASCO|nr:hypothetical protein C6P40_004868 [[Candida] californica]